MDDIDRFFDWMEEPCTCGDVYSHPDGGDSVCTYCGGAEKLRHYLIRQEDEIETLKALLRCVHQCLKSVERMMGDAETPPRIFREVYLEK